MYAVIEVQYDARTEDVEEILDVYVCNEAKQVERILAKCKAVQEGLSAEAEATLEWEGKFDPNTRESWLWGREVETEALVIGYCIKVPDVLTGLEG